MREEKYRGNTCQTISVIIIMATLLTLTCQTVSVIIILATLVTLTCQTVSVIIILATLVTLTCQTVSVTIILPTLLTLTCERAVKPNQVQRKHLPSTNHRCHNFWHNTFNSHHWASTLSNRVTHEKLMVQSGVCWKITGPPKSYA